MIFDFWVFTNLSKSNNLFPVIKIGKDFTLAPSNVNYLFQKVKLFSKIELSPYYFNQISVYIAILQGFNKLSIQ